MALKGLVVSGMVGLAAVLLMAKGWSLKRQDQALRARLVPVKARVTDAGDVASISTFTQSDGTERQDETYEGRYEYVVGSTTYAGSHSSSSRVFERHQMPPNTIDAYYDRTNPAVSRLQLSPDDTGRNYIRFGVGVLALAIVMAVIANLGALTATPAR
jgi:hypothetical protein